jgi:hypothetical protein
MNLTATGNGTNVKLKPVQAIGLHKDGKTCVKETSCGKFAVVSTVPRKNGSLRLIKLFTDSLHARRYNFAIHGDYPGE